MRAYGLTYDTGFSNAGTTTHEPFDPDIVRREMRIIRDDLHCDAVRITGGHQDRLETAARHAAAAGLEVWYCPFTNDLTRAELRAFLLDGAERAERLRRDGAEVVFLTGSEISLFTHGFLPGDTLDTRLAVLRDPARLRAVLPAARAGVATFLADVLPAVRDRFAGRVSYASLPFEDVDWTAFDIVATDAAYRDATTPVDFREQLRAQTARPKPFAVTEFGCTTHRGAADLGGRGDSMLEWDAHARPVRLTRPVVRDEREQADYLRELLDIYDADGVDSAFVNTFVRRDLTTSDDPERDFDAASFGIVTALGPGRSGATYPGLPWEPKAAFHALAEYGRTRAARRR
ncbi:hypothetical protein [Micromonospora sp. NPDC023956]|uniref:hypothetical protein n=1 Tax=Micromonospora sp. NPDC023956 TaxID=3155722 RepID=UPI00340B5BF2